MKYSIIAFKYLQKNFVGFSSIATFSMYSGYYCLYYVLYPISVLINKDKVYMIRTIIFTCFTMYLVILSESLFNAHSPSHYMKIQEQTHIRALEPIMTKDRCKISMANPALSSFWSSYVIMNVMDHYSNGFNMKIMKLSVLLFFGVSLLLLNGFSAFYLGIHSISQVITGFLLGFWIWNIEIISKNKIS